MKTTPFLTAIFVILSVNSSIAQKLSKEVGTFPNDEIPFYIEDGVKLSLRNNTPLVISSLNDAVQGNTPGEMALQWIAQNKELLSVVDVADLVVYSVRNGLAGSNVRLRQHAQGIPLYQSEIVVHISPNNMVTYVTNTFDPSVAVISTSATLTEQQALELAKTSINATGTISFSDNKQLIYNKGEQTKLIYQVTLEPQDPLGSWEILVDAENGTIIRKANRACNHGAHKKSAIAVPPPVIGTGNVFLPDPLSVDLATYAGAYLDNNDATNATFDAAMSNVVLLDINFNGVDYELNGPFAEIKDFENPWDGLFEQPSSAFDYNRFDDEFEAVNCYYHIDNSMRYINNTLGISLMPFQYTSGVRFDPNGLNGADNSHYLGGSGRMSFGAGGVDDAEDADVILHELGHGMHDWLTSGNLSQVNGLSEGSGDYWASSYSRSLNQWTTANAEYYWMFSWDGHNPFWNGRVTNYGALYPGGLTGSIHTDGQIWSTTLLRIYDSIGRTKVDAAFLEGLAMTGSSTNQEDAAIAVRQAAIDMGYSCADVDVFTQEFTTTGYTMPGLPPITGSETSILCTGESITVNGNIYDVSNPTGVEVISGLTAACDSIVTINLTFLPAATGSETSTICASESVVVNGTVYDIGNLAGTEVFFGGAANGCDSTVTVSLTALPPVTSTISTSICDGESITVNGTIYNATNLAGTEVFLGGAANGCDSTVTVSLTALPPVTSTISTSICDGESISVNGTIYDATNLAGTEVFLGGAANGCDSTVTVNLTALAAATGSATNSICYTGNLTVNGTTYDASNPSGTEVFLGGAANGCDSTVTVNLTIEPEIVVTITNTGATLLADQTGATYQWVDCDDSNLPVLGETNQSYTATANGNYAVEITVGNCTETSDCEMVAVNGLDEMSNEIITVYPNPSNGLFTVEIDKETHNMEYSISSIEGKLIQDVRKIVATSILIDLSNESKGVYLLRISVEGDSNVLKLILK